MGWWTNLVQSLNFINVTHDLASQVRRSVAAVQAISKLYDLLTNECSNVRAGMMTDVPALADLGSKIDAEAKTVSPQETPTETTSRNANANNSAKGTRSPTSTTSTSSRISVRVGNRPYARSGLEMVDPFKPLREFFIANLAIPFPNAEQKKDLCMQTKLSDKQLISWFTNTRRRIGWTTIMREHAHGNKVRFSSSPSRWSFQS